jgi:hypothetical protein
VKVVPIGKRTKLLDTERTEIDNTSSATLTQRVEKSRQWTRTRSIGVEVAATTNATFELGAKIINIKNDASTRVATTYTRSASSVETSTGEITVEVPARSKVRVAVEWTQTIEYGVVRYSGLKGEFIAEVPYEVAIGVTCSRLSAS